MSTVSVELSEPLYAAAGELARDAGVTVEHLVASAVAEKVSALAGADWLAARAAKADRAKFEAALAQVPDAEPEEHDRR